MSLQKILKDELSENELKHVPRSFDIIGNREKAVAIMEIPKELQRKKKKIALALMKTHKNVKTVLEKASPRMKKFRTRRFRVIGGNKRTLVVHKESGCLFKLDPQRAYFSSREGTERLRIAEKVKSGETVMVFFAGVGPFAIVIGKKSKPEKIIGIEINPAAVKYFKENVRLNKLINIEVVRGDVKKTARKYYGKCDRVLMPLPWYAANYLKEALLCLRSGGVVHLYCFSKEGEIKEFYKKIESTAKKLKKKVEFLETKKISQWGSGIWKYRIDFSVD